MTGALMGYQKGKSIFKAASGMSAYVKLAYPACEIPVFSSGLTVGTRPAGTGPIVTYMPRGGKRPLESRHGRVTRRNIVRTRRGIRPKAAGSQPARQWHTVTTARPLLCAGARAVAYATATCQRVQ